METLEGGRRLEMAAWAIVFDERERVLLIRENYGRRRYGLPGGSVERDETPWAAAVREALEETTLEVRARHLVAVCSGPLGSRVWVVSFGFRCEVVGGEPRVPDGDEIAEVGWYAPDRWPEPRTVMGPLLLAAALRGERGGCLDGPRPGEEPPGSVWPPDD
jgi:ADP-ribose pyrophosphatase YjhB (NUDIX family)